MEWRWSDILNDESSSSGNGLKPDVRMVKVRSRILWLRVDFVVKAPVGSDGPLRYRRTITEGRCTLCEAMPMLDRISW
jgi:hypothetical protein